MKNPTHVIIILIPLLLLFGCPEPEETIDQDILFEYEYVNWAWGYQHHGQYIDANGDVFFYKYASTDELWEPEDYESLTLEELHEKYNHSKEYALTIDPDTLYAKYLLIQQAAKGTYSDTVNTMADAGGWACLCYQYDSKKDRYKRITLRLSGDWSFENTSPSARALVSWLESLFDITQTSKE